MDTLSVLRFQDKKIPITKFGEPILRVSHFLYIWTVHLISIYKFAFCALRRCSRFPLEALVQVSFGIEIGQRYQRFLIRRIIYEGCIRGYKMRPTLFSNDYQPPAIVESISIFEFRWAAPHHGSERS